MDYPDHTPYGICTCDACEKNQLQQRVAELGKERDALKQQRDDLLAALENCRKELSAWMRDHGDDIATQDAVRAARATIASVKGGSA